MNENKTIEILKELMEKLDRIHEAAEDDMDRAVGYEHGKAAGYMAGIGDAISVLDTKIIELETNALAKQHNPSIGDKALIKPGYWTEPVESILDDIRTDERGTRYQFTMIERREAIWIMPDYVIKWHSPETEATS